MFLRREMGKIEELRKLHFCQILQGMLYNLKYFVRVNENLNDAGSIDDRSFYLNSLLKITRVFKKYTTDN